MIKNIKVFIRKRLEKLLSKRTKRNLKNKLNKLKEKFEPNLDLYKTNLLINSKKKANYNMIMNSVRSKNNNLVIENAHKGSKKKVLVPNVIWPSSRGTYIKQKTI